MFRWIVLSLVLTFAYGAAVLNRTAIVLGGRIVEGSPTNIRVVPYLVSLEERPCAGVLITPLHVLTSAQCIENKVAAELSVRVGSQTLHTGGSLFRISRIIVHPGFDPSSHDYDVAILVLSSPQSWTTRFPQLPLCRDGSCYSHVNEGQMALTAGWGYAMDGVEAHDLRVVRVPIISNEECNYLYEDLGGVSSRMLCAGDTESGGIDACYGDVGGPLVLGRTLVGLVSWGYGCGLQERPGVYTRMSSVAPWIKEKIRESF